LALLNTSTLAYSNFINRCISLPHIR